MHSEVFFLVVQQTLFAAGGEPKHNSARYNYKPPYYAVREHLIHVHDEVPAQTAETFRQNLAEIL